MWSRRRGREGKAGGGSCLEGDDEDEEDRTEGAGGEGEREVVGLTGLQMFFRGW